MGRSLSALFKRSFFESSLCNRLQQTMIIDRSMKKRKLWFTLFDLSSLFASTACAACNNDELMNWWINEQYFSLCEVQAEHLQSERNFSQTQRFSFFPKFYQQWRRRLALSLRVDDAIAIQQLLNSTKIVSIDSENKAWIRYRVRPLTTVRPFDELILASGAWTDFSSSPSFEKNVWWWINIDQSMYCNVVLWCTCTADSSVVLYRPLLVLASC